MASRHRVNYDSGNPAPHELSRPRRIRRASPKRLTNAYVEFDSNCSKKTGAEK